MTLGEKIEWKKSESPYAVTLQKGKAGGVGSIHSSHGFTSGTHFASFASDEHSFFSLFFHHCALRWRIL